MLAPLTPDIIIILCLITGEPIIKKTGCVHSTQPVFLFLFIFFQHRPLSLAAAWVYEELHGDGGSAVRKIQMPQPK